MNENESFEQEQAIMEHDLNVIDEFILELHREAVEVEEALNQHRVQVMEYREGYEAVLELLQNMDPNVTAEEIGAHLTKASTGD